MTPPPTKTDAGINLFLERELEKDIAPYHVIIKRKIEGANEYFIASIVGDFRNFLVTSGTGSGRARLSRDEAVRTVKALRNRKGSEQYTVRMVRA